MAAAHHSYSRIPSRGRSAIALGVAIACSGSALAQSAAPAPADTGASEILTEVTVTGSRISSPGFEAPTPLTVVGEDELRQAGRTDLSATLADMPQFRGTQTATTTNSVTESGQSPADLRGLGSSRTLVLVDNRRYVSSNDLQTIPYSLVKRVDVVTGGASAAYGSDAVAGVVNIILDDEKEGLEVGAQGGLSTHGDAGKRLFEASYGTKLLDDRAHFMVGADYLKDEGIIPGMRRPLIGGAGFFPGADGLVYPTADLHSADHSSGGVITTGPLAGQTFNPDGTLRPFEYGVRDPLRAPRLMIGGEGYQADQYRSASAPIERTNIFSRFSYDVSDSLKVWVEGGYNRVADERVFFSDLAINQAQLEFSRDNPFLDPAIRAQLLAAGPDGETFRMGRSLTDMSLNRYKYERETKQVSIGVDGRLADGQWRYSAYYGRGKQDQDMTLFDITLADEFANAIDAVTGPGGTPVCRVALTDPGTACRPLNLFGSGRADPAAVNYATDNWHSIQNNWLDTAGINISGEPFELWNEPVAVATGVEYRKEQFDVSYDANSLANKFNLINGENIAKTGTNVKEAFLEVAVPLLVERPFAEKLMFNGAARLSDYSTSGSIWSWKLGTTWDIVESFKFRATRSRDIRAANLNELFSTPATYYTSVVDTSLPGDPTTPVILFTGGNPQLAPEIADTLTVGGVFSPGFLPGFQVSLDYYDIKINDVIVALEGQEIVNSCYDQGNSTACGQIVRNPDTGAISTINATYINLAEFRNKGVDIEASYRTHLDAIGLPGQLTVRALANYVDTMTSNNGIATIEGAGYLGSQTAFLVPKWRGNLAFSYESERIGGDLRVRYLDSGGYAPEDVLAIGNNHIASRTYVDLGLRTYIPMMDSARLTVYGSVQNVFDRQPPLAASNSPYFDIIGRYFTLGVRANF